MNTTSQHDWATALRQAGLRVTQPRKVVLNALAGRPHSSAEEIAAQATKELPTLSLQSVYNVLGDLTDVGILRSLELPHQPARYEIDNGDNHHHCVCTKCGVIYDVPCAVNYTPCLTPSDHHNMSIEVADVIYRGICENCRDGLKIAG